MTSRANAPFPVGEVLVTPAYALPCTHVLHCVGPAAEYPDHEQPVALTACYTNLLDAAAAHDMRSIAFCCISTGVFGYPAESAARVALSAVKKWLLDHAEEDHSLERIVFNVFTSNDHTIYSTLGPVILSSENEN